MGGKSFQVGELVLHPNRPEWGPGKVVRAGKNRVHVIWRDLPGREAKTIVLTVVPLQRAPEQTDDVLDNLPPLVEKDGKLLLAAERITFKQAVDRFLLEFPGGFSDPRYLGTADEGERTYKWNAHEQFVERLGEGKLRQLLDSDRDKAVEEIHRIYRSVNLLSPFEKSALTDAFKDQKATGELLARLCDLLESESVTEAVFTPLARAVCNLPQERGRVATWPVATLIPFLAQPDRHIFLKPDVTKKAADTLGFHLNYKSEPNWLTYSLMLKMGRLYKEKLAALQPRDMIDVQSFIWQSCQSTLTGS